MSHESCERHSVAQSLSRSIERHSVERQSARSMAVEREGVWLCERVCERVCVKESATVLCVLNGH